MPVEPAGSSLSSSCPTVLVSTSPTISPVAPAPSMDIVAALANPTSSSWLKNALRTAAGRDPVDAANDAELLASLLAARCSAHLSGTCPSCRAAVSYNAWVPVESEPGLMACPSCLRAIRVDEVYSPSSPADSSQNLASPTAAALHRRDEAVPVIYVITRSNGTDWRYLGRHTASQHRDYLVQCAEVLLPGETLSYSVA